MDRRITMLLAMCAVLVTPVTGSADRPEGPYVGFHGAAGLLTDARNEIELVGFADPSEDSEFDAGFVVGGVLGYAAPSVLANGRFGPLYTRWEVEITYRENDFDALESVDPVRGEVSSLNGMFNLWLDIDTRTRLTPYFGGGLGVANVEWHEVENPGQVLGVGVDDDDTVFAYHFGAGLGFRVTPWLVLSLDYRYFGTVDPDFKIEGTDQEFESEYRGHGFGGGLRYFFY